MVRHVQPGHLAKVRQTYARHAWFALRWGAFLIWSGLLSIVHGLIPALFPFAAPRNVLRVARLIRSRAVPGETDELDLIHRGRIGQTLRLIEADGTAVNYDQFLSLIDGFKANLKPWSRPGMQVAVYAENSAMTYALGFALWECGLCFFGDTFKTRLLERALETVQVDAIFVDRENFDSVHAAVAGRCRVEQIPDLKSWLERAIARDTSMAGEPETAILLGYTSGSSGGPPQAVYHSHRSLLAASRYMAERHYPQASRALIYLNLNHLGYISCILLPAFWAGCEIYILKDAAPHGIVRALAEHRPQIVPLFSYNWLQIVADFPHVRLDGVESVVTGGDLISREFVTEALDRGARRVLNVYGMTEALPPVAIQETTAENLADFRGEDLGELAPYIRAEIRQNDEIYLSGPNVGLPSHRWVATGDRGSLQTNGRLAMSDRKKNFLKIGDREISCSDVQYFLRGLRWNEKPLIEHAFGDGIEVFPLDKDRVVAAIHPRDMNALAGLTKEYVNAELSQRFGDGMVIDELLIEDKLPFNGIKIDVNTLRNRLKARTPRPLPEHPPRSH